MAVTPWLWFVVRDVHPLLDGVAIVLPLLGGATVLLSLWLGLSHYRPALLFSASVLLLLPVAVLGPRQGADNQAPPTGFRMMSANLESKWFTDNDFDWYLEQNSPALLVASELQRSHRDDLRARFPEFVDDVIIEEQFREEPDEGDESYKRFGFPSIGVYSVYPITELEDTTEIEFGMPGMRVQVDLPTGPIVVYALHVPKPALGSGPYQVGFGEHRDIAAQLATSIAAETLPVVVIGDLNMTDRGGSYRTMLGAGVRDAMVNGSPTSTSTKGFWWNLLLLRIDHIMVSDELCVSDQRYDLIDFSDHLVILSDVGPCPGELNQ